MKTLTLKWKYVNYLSAYNASSNFGRKYSLYINMIDAKKNIHKRQLSWAYYLKHYQACYGLTGLRCKNLVLAIYSHFLVSAKRREQLKRYMILLNWNEITRRVGIRWLSLNAYIEWSWLNYVAKLGSYFLGLPKDPVKIKKLHKVYGNPIVV